MVPAELGQAEVSLEVNLRIRRVLRIISRGTSCQVPVSAGMPQVLSLLGTIHAKPQAGTRGGLM